MSLLEPPPGTDAALPSIFEVSMVDRMDESLRPALQYAVGVLCDHWPRLSWAVVHFDELFAGSSLLVQGYHLRHYDSLVSERFFGFKRVAVASNGGAAGEAGRALAGRDRSRALFFAAVVPYLAKRARDWFEQQAGPMTPFGTREPPAHLARRPQLLAGEQFGVRELAEWTTRHARWAAMHAFPLVHSLAELGVFSFQAAFLMGKTRFHAPSFRGLRQELCRLGKDEAEQQAKAALTYRERALTAAQQSRWRGLAMLKSFVLKMLWLGLDWAKYALVASVLMFKGFEWWYGAEVQAQRTPVELPVPRPPAAPVVHPDGVGIPAQPSCCPLSGETCKNPAASVSGYVFSYKPLFDFVSENGCCPITRAAMTVDEIRRVFI